MAEYAKNDKGDEMFLTFDDLEVIRKTFYNNKPLLKVLRKVFIPTLDPNAPLRQMFDLYSIAPITPETPPEEVKIAWMARNQLISHLEQCIGTLYILSQPEPKKDIDPKNSNK